MISPLIISIICFIIFVVSISLFIYIKMYFSGLLLNTSNAKLKQDISEFILSKSLVKDTLKKVKKSPFISRRNVIMSTIGKSNYLDGDILDTDYSITNNYIRNEFTELLDTILNFFKEKFKKEKVMYLADINNKKFSLPGFHVFDCNWISTFQVASVHKDLQYLKLAGVRPHTTNNENTNILDIDIDIDIDLDKTLSFTICLEAQEGPHLYIYEKNIHEKDTLHSINYIPGHIVCHNGHDFHMIAPNKRVDQLVKRITVQGHIIYDKITKTHFIYW